MEKWTGIKTLVSVDDTHSSQRRARLSRDAHFSARASPTATMTSPFARVEVNDDLRRYTNTQVRPVTPLRPRGSWL